MPDLERYVLREDDSVRQALAKIERNKIGAAFVKNSKEMIIGSLTDGDIRRALLSGAELKEAVDRLVNRDFRFVRTGTSHENMLKELDTHVKALPVLSPSGKLLKVVTIADLIAPAEKPIFARSRAPVRVSFGGGGSDLTYFFKETDGAVINTTINIYAHATLRKREDEKIRVFSTDLAGALKASNLEQLLNKKGKFKLIVSLLKNIQPDFGFDLYLRSDFPVGSGLGGSASVSAAILGCFNVFRNDKWSNHDIAEIAFQAERLSLGVAGGWQDQYAAAFGGFNFIEFKRNENTIHPLRIPADTICELEESLILCDTGITHKSGQLHKKQAKAASKSAVRDLVKINVELTYKIRNQLLKGELREFGKSLNEAWLNKRSLSDAISNNKIDTIYNGAIKNGALGGKLMGAGGGGFMIFLVDEIRRTQVEEFLRSKNLELVRFNFESSGLKSWSCRDEEKSTGGK